MTTPDRDELQRRTDLAQAILTQRTPDPTTITLALCALDGVPIETLIARPVTEDTTRHDRDTSVDWQRITTDLRVAIITRGISQRGIARAIGVDDAAITRLLQGKHLSADPLAALVVWLYPQDQAPRWITRVVIDAP